ncbi:hypothetical protein AD951_07625 [Acetobacter malorum]|uniref:Uncharacterized protein n=1 Tax=Acetobacter malorum TaxID=178901 RepID=A0A149UMI6_9PROT|nr:hypothetical protein [Acetobacter malorum]KXV69200.1 hypothetical protein AD951_07625 [Acetobacter malorum]
MALQWFDLKEQGAKLERPDNGRGETFLRLTLDKEATPEQIKAASERGWIPDREEAGRVFTNFARFTRLSEVADLVSVFIEREKVAESKTDAARLRQGEIIRGFADASLSQSAGMLPKLDSVAQSLPETMPAELRDRILRRVEAAQKLVGVAPGADGRALFRNDGAQVWQALTEKFGAHDATKAMLTVMHMAESDGDRFSAAHDALLDAAESGQGLPDMSASRDAARRAAYKVDAIKGRADVLRSYDPSWTDDRFYRDFMRSVKAQYRTWDGARIDFSGVQEPAQFFGNTFRADPNLPTAWRHDLGHRISQAVQFAAMEVGVSPSELFHGQKQLFHVGLTEGNTLGYRAGLRMKINGAMHHATGIKINPFNAGVLMHEIGHGIDLGARLSATSVMHGNDMLRAMLVDTGVQEQVCEMVDRMEAAGLMDERHAAYMKMPDEIIARSFEAAMSHRADMAGDPFFQEMGGMAVLNGSVTAQPTPELADKFLTAMKSVVAASLTRQAVADIDREYDTNTSPSP